MRVSRGSWAEGGGEGEICLCVCVSLCVSEKERERLRTVGPNKWRNISLLNLQFLILIFVKPRCTLFGPMYICVVSLK